MRYTLTKLSGEGWEKNFNTLQEVHKELQKYICVDCVDYYGWGLEYMLVSDCGWEFLLEENEEGQHE